MSRDRFDVWTRRAEEIAEQTQQQSREHRTMAELGPEQQKMRAKAHSNYSDHDRIVQTMKQQGG